MLRLRGMPLPHLAQLRPRFAPSVAAYPRARCYSTESQDLYQVLGVRPSASQAQIKQRFIALSKELHPDVHWAKTENCPDMHKKFASVSHAYAVLGDVRARREYDEKRRFDDHQPMRGDNPYSQWTAAYPHNFHEGMGPDEAAAESKLKHSLLHRPEVMFSGFLLSLVLGVCLQWVYLRFVDTPEERLQRKIQSSQAIVDLYDWERNPVRVSSGGTRQPGRA